MDSVIEKQKKRACDFQTRLVPVDNHHCTCYACSAISSPHLFLDNQTPRVVLVIVLRHSYRVRGTTTVYTITFYDNFLMYCVRLFCIEYATRVGLQNCLA